MGSLDRAKESRAINSIISMGPGSLREMPNFLYLQN